MERRTSSRAVAVIVGLLVAACLAALALATTNDRAVAQQGCTGGGSPSPSSPSPSESEGETFPPIPSIPPSLIPVPGADQKAAPERVQAGPNRDAARDVVQNDEVVAAQQRTCNSTITIAYDSGRNPKFTGKVGSAEPMCKRARDVTIKKVKRGKDATVAKTTTNAKGNYTAPARQANGRFYAKVSKATTENRDGQPVTCKAARSRTIRP